MKENSKAVTGSYAAQADPADPATHCAEKDGLEGSHDPPAPLKLGLCVCYHVQLSRI